MACAAALLAVSVPLTVMVTPEAAVTVAPGAMVTVTPASIVSDVVSILPSAQVSSVVTGGPGGAGGTPVPASLPGAAPLGSGVPGAPGVLAPGVFVVAECVSGVVSADEQAVRASAAATNTP